MPILPREIKAANEYLGEHGKKSRWTPELTVAMHRAGLNGEIGTYAIAKLCRHLEGLKPEQRQATLASANAVLRSKGTVDAFQHLMEKAKGGRNVTPLPSFEEMRRDGRWTPANAPEPSEPFELARPRVRTPEPAPFLAPPRAPTPLPTPALIDRNASTPLPQYTPAKLSEIFGGAGLDNGAHIMHLFPHAGSSHRIAQAIENDQLIHTSLKELRDVVINGWHNANTQREAAELLARYHSHEAEAIKLLERNSPNRAVNFLLEKAKNIFEPAPGGSEERRRTPTPMPSTTRERATPQPAPEPYEPPAEDSPSIPQGAIVVKHDNLSPMLKSQVTNALIDRENRLTLSGFMGIIPGLGSAAIGTVLPVSITTRQVLLASGGIAAVTGLLGYKNGSREVRTSTRSALTRNAYSIDAAGKHKVEELRKTHPFAKINRKGDVVLLPDTKFQRALHAAQQSLFKGLIPARYRVKI